MALLSDSTKLLVLYHNRYATRKVSVRCYNRDKSFLFIGEREVKCDYTQLKYYKFISSMKCFICLRFSVLFKEEIPK